jgi:hypothetical protein
MNMKNVSSWTGFVQVAMSALGLVKRLVLCKLRCRRWDWLSCSMMGAEIVCCGILCDGDGCYSFKFVESSEELE